MGNVNIYARKTAEKVIKKKYGVDVIKYVKSKIEPQKWPVSYSFRIVLLSIRCTCDVMHNVTH